MPYPPFLFLPGWGFSGQVLNLAHQQYSWVKPEAPLDPATAQAEILDFLAEQNLEAIQLVGWSMGASLAFDFACAFPEKVETLTLLGMRASWPPSEIVAIRLALEADPGAFLRDFYRKSLLGYKKEFRRFVVEQQEELMESLDMQALGRGLDYLAQWRLLARGVRCPVFCWHGRRDIIAPVAQQAIIPGAHVVISEHGGHALFLDREFVPW
ncbi:MAG: alpha/beta hydrolase [Desulfurivibrionaceae bacterium]